MKQRVTLRDLAAIAKVHYSTVSLALRNHHRVSPSVRKKIQRLAQKMGYIPDPMLAALNAYRKTKTPVSYHSTLAWINNWEHPEHLRMQPTFNDYFIGASERARQLGYTLEEFHIHKLGVTPKRLSSMLRSRGVEGILLAPQYNVGPEPDISYKYFSTIAFGYSYRPHIFNLVTNHQFQSMTMLLENISKHGYTRPGLFLYMDVDAKVNNSYVSAFWNFSRLHPNMEYLNPLMPSQDETVQNEFLYWYKKNKPDSIIFIGSWNIQAWLKQLNLHIPKNIGLAQLSVNRHKTFESGIYENGLLIGQTAIDYLVGMIQRGEKGIPETPIRILVEGKWFQGKSLQNQKLPFQQSGK